MFLGGLGHLAQVLIFGVGLGVSRGWGVKFGVVGRRAGWSVRLRSGLRLRPRFRPFGREDFNSIQLYTFVFYSLTMDEPREFAVLPLLAVSTPAS
jgi:hypothetical protein